MQAIKDTFIAFYIQRSYNLVKQYDRSSEIMIQVGSSNQQLIQNMWQNISLISLILNSLCLFAVYLLLYMIMIQDLSAKIACKQELPNKKLETLEMLKENKQKQEINEIICSYYSLSSHPNMKDNKFIFGFLYFLIDICQNVQQSTLCGFKIFGSFENFQNKNKQQSLLTQQMYYSFFYRYLPLKAQQFYLFDLTKKSQNKQISNKLSENIQSLREYEAEQLYLSDQNQQIKLIQAIKYEDKEYKVCQDILKCLIKKNELIHHLLYSQRINLSSLQNQLKNVRNNLQYINQELKELINLNPFNVLIPQLVDIIESEFCCDRSLTQYLRNMKIFFLKKDHSNLKVKQYIKQTIELTNLTDSVILFLSLREKNPFIVKKATLNYFDFFNWDIKNQPLIGQSINVLMPYQIASFHDEVINKFYYQSQRYKEENLTLDQISSREQIGIDGRGWATSYMIYFQLTIFSATEIGICSRIQKQKEFTDCLIVDASTLQIISISQNLHEKLIGHSNLSNQIKNIKINKMIKEIETFIQELDENNSEYGLLDTTLIKPSIQLLKRHCLLQKSFGQYDQEEPTVFQLKADCMYKKSKYLRIIQIKVISLRQINNCQDSLNEVELTIAKRISTTFEDKKLYQSKNFNLIDKNYFHFQSGSFNKFQNSPISRFSRIENLEDETPTARRQLSQRTELIASQTQSNNDNNFITDRIFSNSNLLKRQSQMLRIKQIQIAESEGGDKISHDDNIENIKFQVSETRSRQTDLTYNKFQLMARNIHSKTQIFGLKLINIFGVAFFILIMILSIVMYSMLNAAYVSQQNEILNLDWPSQVQISLQQVISDLSFQQLTQDTYIANNLFQKNEKNNLTPRIKAQLKNQLSQLKGYVVKHLLMTYPNQQVQDQLLSQRISYQFESKINQFVTIKSTSTYRLEHIVYFMLESVFAVANSTQSFIETNDRLIKDNFENLQLSYSGVSNAIEDAINLKFQALNNQAKITFYTILCVAIAFFLFFQGIYYYIQSKRNKILKGVCSFTQTSLIAMIDSNKQKQLTLEEVLNYCKRSNDCIQSSKQFLSFKLQKEKQLFENNEKKNVVRSKKIVQLKQLNIILSFFCLLSLSLIQLYSFSNFILVERFTQLQIQERLFLNTLTSVQAAMNRSIAYTPILLHLKVYYPQEFQFYYQKYSAEIKQNLGLNDQLFQLYSQQQYVNRNNQTFFMYFMNGMFTGDACNITQQYSYYVNGGGYNVTDCYLVKDRILSQGMIAALTQLYSYLQQQFDVIAQKDIKNFIASEKAVLQSFSLYQQNQFRVNFQQIFSANKRCIRYQIIGDYQGIIDKRYYFSQFANNLSQNYQSLSSNNYKIDIDYILRIIFQQQKFSYDEYISDFNSIHINNLYVYHKISCTEKLNSCFCQNTFDIVDRLQENTQKQLMIEIICSYYKIYNYQNINDNKFRFGLLYFLVDACQNFQQSILCAYQLFGSAENNNYKIKKQSLYTQQIYFYFLNKYLPSKSREIYLLNLNQTAYVQNGIKKNTNHFKKNTKNQQEFKAGTQELENKENQNLKLIQIIHYEEKEISVCQRIQKCLKQKIDILQYLLNSQNIILQEQINQTRELSKLSDSVILFLSLNEKNPFIVQKVTQNYHHLLNWDIKNQSLIGQSINVLMPSQIASFHDEVIMKYYFKPQKYSSESLQLDNISSREQIGIDGKGWATCYKIQFQITVLSSLEIGVCSRIQKEKQYVNCLIADANTLQIIAISENLHYKLLDQNTNSNQVQNLKINRLIKNIEHYLEKLDQSNQEYGVLETILLKPTFQSGKVSYVKKQSQELEQDKSEAFKMKAYCIYKKSNYHRYIQLKIYSLKQIYNYQASQNEINAYKEEKMQPNQDYNKNKVLKTKETSFCLIQGLEEETVTTKREHQTQRTELVLSQQQFNIEVIQNNERILSNVNLLDEQNQIKIQMVKNDKNDKISQDTNFENLKFNFSDSKSRQTDLSSSKLKMITKNIYSRSSVIGLRLINLFGLLYFTLIVISSTINYYILNNAYLKQQNEIFNLDWPSQIQNSLQQVIADLSFQQLIQDTYIKQTFFQKNEVRDLTLRIQYQLKNQLSQLKGFIIKHLLITYPNQKIQDQLLSKRIQYQFISQINQFVTVQSTSLYRLEHIVYFMTESVFAVANSTQSFIQTNDKLIKENFENLQASYKSVSQAIRDAINLKFQALASDAKITFITIFCLSLVFFIFFIIVYYYIQSKRNIILKAISQFTDSQLVNMIDLSKQRQLMIEEILNFNKKQNEMNLVHQQIQVISIIEQNRQKELNQSEGRKNGRRSKKIIQLKKFNLLMSFLFLLSLTLTQFYSLSNLVLVERFIQLQVQERLFLDTLTSVQTALNRSFTYNPVLLYLKMYNPKEFELYYQKYSQEIIKSVNLNNQLLNLYPQQQNIDRQNQTIYMYFTDSMYKGDACAMTQQYATYVNGGGFNITDCYQVKDNVFSKGIIGGITWIYQHFKYQFDVVAQQDLKNFVQQEKSLLNDFSIYQQNQFRINFQQIMSANKLFIRLQITEDYQNAINKNYFYFLLQIKFVSIIFILVWIKFYYYLKKTYLETKQSLNMFDLNSLANNQKLFAEINKIK
ncbi:hypothetical protein ABPG73_011769 [Tetrahymena malaccensis]